MPQNTTIGVTHGEWMELTNSNATSVTFQNVGKGPVYVKGSVDSVAPTHVEGSLYYRPGQGERNTPLSDLFPGITGVNRLWVFAETPSRMMISHA